MEIFSMHNSREKSTPNCHILNTQPQRSLTHFQSIHWKDWCRSWSSNTLATWWEELTHWKRPWCWERLRAGGEGDDRGWDGGMASLTGCTRVWASSRSWWWTGKPGMLQAMGSQRVGHDWATTEPKSQRLCTDTSLVWIKIFKQGETVTAMNIL